jgi:hypothetical protein
MNLKTLKEMNLIERYKEKQNDKKIVKIVINSNYDYENHDLNILKECLMMWSKEEDNFRPPIDFQWIFCNPKYDEKMFFVTTSIGQLKLLRLQNIIKNDKILTDSYMNRMYDDLLFGRDPVSYFQNKNIA